MTPVDPHPSLDILADLTGDVRDDGEIRTARIHLTSCSICAATYEALSSLPARLAATPPPPMPLDVVARIDAAIVRAAQERASPANAANLVRRPNRRYRRATLARWVLGVAATAAASVAIGLVVTNGVPLGGSADHSSDSASGFSESATSDGPAAAGDTSTTSPGFTVAAPNSDLDSAVLALVARTEARQSTSPKTAATEVDPSSEGVNFESCVATVNAATGRSLVPIAADTTRYAGQDVVLLVFPRNDPSTVQAYVLTASCLASADDVDFAMVLVTETTVHR